MSVSLVTPAGYVYYSEENQHVQDFKYWNALNASDYAYSRYRQGCVWAYRRDNTSPTGVLLVCGHVDADRAYQLGDMAGRAFPYSPTEGLNKSGANAYA